MQHCGVHALSSEILSIPAPRPSALDLQLGRALRELASLHSPYRVLGDIIDYGIWVCDAAGHNIYASQSLLDLLGVPHDEFEGLGWVSFLHPDDAAETARAWAECVATGGVWSREVRYRGRDGTYRDVLTRGKAVRNAAGEIALWVGLNLDVWESKNTERALAHEIEHGRADRARLELALAASGMIGVWDGDLVAGTVYGDENYARIYGFDPAQTTGGKPLRFYDRYIHPEDLAESNAERARMAAGADEYSNIHRVCRPDGSIVWVHARGRLLRDMAGRPARFLGISVDITQRKRAEIRQDFLLRLQDAMRLHTEPRGILNAAAGLLGLHLGAARIGFGEVQPDEETVIVTCCHADGVPEVNGVFPLAAFGVHNAAKARQGITTVATDVLADPNRTQDHWDQIGTRAHVSVPLIRNGRYTGSLYVTHIRPHRWEADEVGLIEEVAARIWDAVERGRAEVKLRESEERARLALESGGLGPWEFDIATRQLIRSARHDQIFGYAEPPPDWGYERLQAHLPQEHRDILAAGFRATLETGAEFHVESPITRADGVPGWIEIRAKRHDGPDGKPSRVLGTVADITARKHIETAALENAAQFEMFAQAMPNHVWTARPDGALDWANQRAYDYSCTKVLHIHPDDWATTVHPEDAPEAHRRWQGALTSGKPYEAEFRLRRHDGLYRWFIARAVPIRGEDGRILRWIGTNTDIEEQKSTERALADLNATLEQQVEERSAALMAAEHALRQSQKMEAVGQLTGGLAHDFNNLLAGISGSLEMLEHRLAQGRFKELDRYLHVAQSAAKRAAALTHRLLAFSRQQNLEPKPTDINRLVAGMDELIRRTVGPEVAVHVLPCTGAGTTLVDPNQLENALLNLCINARDAMPDGGRITIETALLGMEPQAARELDLAAGEYVALMVRDTGSGMPPEVIARAFDPFFTTKPLGEGTGLGLSMVYGFVRQSGGQARITSEPGMGTEICLLLPRFFGDAEELAQAPQIADAKRAEANEAVLVVDDEPSIRMLIAEVLEELGYEPVEASDGKAALKILETPRRLDLLITDVGLPGGMNGRQLADAALRLRPELKVLFITGYAEQSVIADARQRPGVHVVTKPFAMEALANRIKEIISGK